MQEIFDTELKLKHLKRASKYFVSSAFLYEETANRLTDNFGNNIRTVFDEALALGDKNGILSDFLEHCLTINKVNETALLPELLSNKNRKQEVINYEILPFEEQSFNLIASNLSMHWVNDIVGLLVQIKAYLKKGGFFISNILGGETLTELRKSMILAESEFGGGSMRVSPMMGVKDGAALLQRAGFKEPVSTNEVIDVKYDDLNTLLHDLQNMGEQNSLIQANKQIPPKKFWTKVEQIYREQFSDENGTMNAKFEVISLSGWG